MIVKRNVILVGAGGEGIKFVRALLLRLVGFVGIASLFADTDRPPDLPAMSFIPLRSDLLADQLSPAMQVILRLLGLSAKDFRELKRHTGVEGFSQIPAMSYLAGLAALDDMVRALEAAARLLSSESKGVDGTFVMTFSSLMGGCGAAASRCFGLATRQARNGFAADTKWFHVGLTSTLLPEAMRTRRTRALEHRFLMEMKALMAPGASLPVPNSRRPIDQPGPDGLILLGGTGEAPRSVSDVADEVAALIENLVTA